MQLSNKRIVLLNLGLAGLPALGACGSPEGSQGYLGSDAGSGGSATSSSAASANSTMGSGGTQSIDLGNTVTGGGTGPDIQPGTVTACSPGPDTAGCVGVSFEGESIPLDIYVMFDLSCSMSCSVDHSGCCRNSNDPDPVGEWRIQPVREAMKAFLQDPLSAGIGVGLGFFGDHSTSQNTDPEVCSVAAHSDATVEIQKLPGAAEALIAELDAGEPQGGTPTHLAIEGACSYTASWKAQNPSHKVVVLLVTDGIPEFSCEANIDKATSAAEACYGDGTGFQTYVLGVVANNNNSLDQLNGIAEAGGTERAYLTDTNDVAGSVLAALNAIRADAVIPCELKIPPPPPGQTLDPTLVNLGICDAAGDVVVTPYVESEALCNGSPGWYYDDPNSPASIHLCDVTCDTVSAAGSSLFYNVGCARRTEVY